MQPANPVVTLIVKAIQEGHTTIPEIAKEMNIPDLNVAVTLRRMYNDGIVRRLGKLSLGKSGNPPTQWEVIKEPILKKFTAIYCENDHLYCVVLQDVFSLKVLTKKIVEIARDQGHVRNNTALRNCNICGGGIRVLGS